ncbi:hypothetical protein E2562_023892 [Oryza meyeriana var. granulata]|uniref:Uncharacterized protein n=1 Tax=Oryza meyeriana var. granulata TaxID=110450 RepID=A0A6G1D633_9ORYZ|nr:hypothetical protein E2562_023892 [Oryza meyeriana var. granulata]
MDQRRVGGSPRLSLPPQLRRPTAAPINGGYFPTTPPPPSSVPRRLTGERRRSNTAACWSKEEELELGVSPQPGHRRAPDAGLLAVPKQRTTRRPRTRRHPCSALAPLQPRARQRHVPAAARIRLC